MSKNLMAEIFNNYNINTGELYDTLKKIRDMINDNNLIIEQENFNDEIKLLEKIGIDCNDIKSTKKEDKFYRPYDKNNYFKDYYYDIKKYLDENALFVNNVIYSEKEQMLFLFKDYANTYKFLGVDKENINKSIKYYENRIISNKADISMYSDLLKILFTITIIIGFLIKPIYFGRFIEIMISLMAINFIIICYKTAKYGV